MRQVPNTIFFNLPVTLSCEGSFNKLRLIDHCSRRKTTWTLMLCHSARPRKRNFRYPTSGDRVADNEVLRSGGRSDNYRTRRCKERVRKLYVTSGTE